MKCVFSCLSRIYPVNLLRLPAMVTCVIVSSPSTPATLTQGCGGSIWSVSHRLYRTWCILFRENGKQTTVCLKKTLLWTNILYFRKKKKEFSEENISISLLWLAWEKQLCLVLNFSA